LAVFLTFPFLKIPFPETRGREERKREEAVLVYETRVNAPSFPKTPVISSYGGPVGRGKSLRRNREKNAVLVDQGIALALGREG